MNRRGRKRDIERVEALEAERDMLQRQVHTFQTNLAHAHADIEELRRHRDKLAERMESVLGEAHELRKDRVRLLRACDRADAVLSAFLSDKCGDLHLLEEMHRVQKLCSAAMESARATDLRVGTRGDQ